MKNLKGIAVGVLVLATILMFANVANSQTKFRDWLCDIFLCSKFVELETRVIGIEAELQVINQELAEVKSILQAFDTTELSQQIELSMKPEAAIWMQHNRTEANMIYIDIYMKGEALAEYQAFGADFIFDHTGYAFIAMERGPLFEGFAMFDSNLITDGRLRWGAVAGSERGIVGTTLCLIATMQIQSNSQGITAFHIENLVDDIADLRPTPTHLQIEVN